MSRFVTSSGIWQATPVTPDRPPLPPRTPLKVAVITFGAIVLIGTMIALAVFGMGDTNASAAARGEKLGQGIGTFAVVCAGIAYFVQHNRLKRG